MYCRWNRRLQIWMLHKRQNGLWGMGLVCLSVHRPTVHAQRPKNDGEDGLEHGEEASRAYKGCKIFNMEQVSMAAVVTSPPHTFTLHIWTLLNIMNFPLCTVVSIFWGISLLSYCTFFKLLKWNRHLKHFTVHCAVVDRVCDTLNLNLKILFEIPFSASHSHAFFWIHLSVCRPLSPLTL